MKVRTEPKIRAAEERSRPRSLPSAVFEVAGPGRGAAVEGAARDREADGRGGARGRDDPAGGPRALAVRSGEGRGRVRLRRGVARNLWWSNGPFIAGGRPLTGDAFPTRPCTR